MLVLLLLRPYELSHAFELTSGQPKDSTQSLVPVSCCLLLFQIYAYVW